MFIRVQNTIISKQSIIAIKPITLNDVYYIAVIQYENIERFSFNNCAERDAEIERLWKKLIQPY